MFTGDRSGDFLFGALARNGFANQGTSVSRDDGLVLRDAYVGAAVRCAPPANKPLPREAENCRVFLRDELALLTRVRVVLALGKFAHDAYLRHLQSEGDSLTLARFPFGHGAEHVPPRGPRLVDTYHPSQQNTFTGKLRPRDLDRVLGRVVRRLRANGA